MKIHATLIRRPIPRIKAELATFLVSLVVASTAHAGAGSQMFCELVRSEMSAAVKAAQSGTSLQAALAQVQAKTTSGTNPIWTQKRINLVEGIYASREKLNPKDEAEFEYVMCVGLGPDDYMKARKNPNKTWAESGAETDKRIEELEREIAHIDRGIAANKAAMDQNNADYQRRLQARATADAVGAEINSQNREAKPRPNGIERKTLIINSRPFDCLAIPIGNTMTHLDCN